MGFTSHNSLIEFYLSDFWNSTKIIKAFSKQNLKQKNARLEITRPDHCNQQVLGAVEMGITDLLLEMKKEIHSFSKVGLLTFYCS